MAWMTDPQAWIALATLTALEIVLGIDNILFITILVSRLPASQMQRARVIGLALAMISRIVLLISLSWVMSLVAPLFSLLGEQISGRDLNLIGVTLVAEGLDFHIPKGYIYFSMAFSVFVEILNIKMRSRSITARA